MNGMFLPSVMGNMTELEDYVFFKLDIDSGEIERGIVDFILSSSDDIQHVKEFVWEHHVAGNYIMASIWGALLKLQHFMSHTICFSRCDSGASGPIPTFNG
jgi:hypothetical protein